MGAFEAGIRRDETKTARLGKGRWQDKRKYGDGLFD